MARGFQGKIELHIRDSQPDWAPYLAPKAPDGSPNVLLSAARSTDVNEVAVTAIKNDRTAAS